MSVEGVRSFDSRVSSRLPKKRQRFTPWLGKQINQGGIDGLEWIDKEKGLFRVPWVRVDKTEFELETHAELFKRWAQHTGKCRQGDPPHPSTWKTRFRCALRKMQEIVEIKELGSLEGSKPYRAFKFIKTKLKDRQRYQPDQSTPKTRLQEIKKLRRSLEGSKPYRAFKFKTNMNVSDGRVILSTRETQWSLEENKPHRAFSFKPKPKDKPVQLKPVFLVQPCHEVNEERGSSPLGLKFIRAWKR